MRGSLPRALAAAAMIVSGTTAVTWASGHGDTAQAAAATRVVLSDDFTGDRGDAPDDAVWSVTGRGTARLDGEGLLALGSVLRTDKVFDQAYGHAEARIRMDRAEGAWRALGILDTAGRIPAGRVETLAPDRVDARDFHTYAIDWTPTTLVWSMDGRQVIRFTPEQRNLPKVFVLNLASGGRFASGMLVDQVRVTVQVPVDTSTAKQWKAFTGYRVGDLVRFRGVVYRVREAHTSLPDWKPDLMPAVFEKV